MASTIIAKVVVRIPPPDEFGEEPMNISPQYMVNVAGEKAFISMVAKPALRVLSELKVAKKNPSTNPLPTRK